MFRIRIAVRLRIFSVVHSPPNQLHDPPSGRVARGKVNRQLAVWGGTDEGSNQIAITDRFRPLVSG